MQPVWVTVTVNVSGAPGGFKTDIVEVEETFTWELDSADDLIPLQIGVRNAFGGRLHKAVKEYLEKSKQATQERIKGL